MSFEYQEHFQYFTNLCLNVTDSCNLACVYCFVEQHPHYMSLEVAKQSVDLLVDNTRKRNKLLPKNQRKATISYFGGEPTLMWDEIIVPLTLYIEDTYPNEVALNMTTNGTLLNYERVQFLKQHKISILLSIDGGEKIQNINRPCRDGSSSFEKVSKNIPYILEAFPATTFRGTIQQATVSETFDTYLFAIRNGFRNIFLIPNAREVWTEENKAILKNQLGQIYTFMLGNFLEGRSNPIGFSLIESSFTQIFEKDRMEINKSYCPTEIERIPVRCGLGTTSISVGYDGNLYGCQEQTSRNTESKFYIGNVYDGIDIELHSKLLARYAEAATLKCENASLCEECPLRATCFSHCCPSVNLDLFDDFFINPEIHCLWKRYMFDYGVALMKILVKDNNIAFKDYLENKCQIKRKECVHG